MDMLSYFLGRLAGGNTGGTNYKSITYNDDDTITLIGTDDTEHTMVCTYEGGKLIDVTYDGKAVELIYDGDVLVKVGKTVFDLGNAPEESKTTTKADSSVTSVLLPVYADEFKTEINGTVQVDSFVSLEE